MAQCNILKLNLMKNWLFLSDLLELSEESVEKRCREMMDRFDLDVLILTCGVQEVTCLQAIYSHFWIPLM